VGAAGPGRAGGHPANAAETTSGAWSASWSAPATDCEGRTSVAPAGS
jgi:hypothetical protein